MRKTLISLCKRLCVLVVTILFLLTGTAAGSEALAMSPTPESTVKVLAVGGSSAHGWDDPHHKSYLLRAFRSFARTSDLTLSYDDKTIPGAPSVSVSKDQFTRWLNADKPQFVILSWGILDDIHNHTPIDQFSDTLQSEIQQSLAANAKVLIVTPPAVEASVQNLQSQYEKYALAEYATVQLIHNPNVYWFDLHQQTLRYIQAHGSEVQYYCANSWHPNTQGQALGGRILFDDVQEAFIGS